MSIYELRDFRAEASLGEASVGVAPSPLRNLIYQSVTVTAEQTKNNFSEIARKLKYFETFY